MTTLRRDGTCAVCRHVLPATARAFYDPVTKQISCSGHHPEEARRAGHGRRVDAAPTAETEWDPREGFGGRSSRDRGPRVRGPRTASARVFADAKADAYRSRVRSTWGPVAPLVLLLAPRDAEVRAAEKGAAGEERLTAFLDRMVGGSAGSVAVLHDRTIPGRRENVDHLVVCPSGVWAVDAKAYSGLLSTGGWWSRSRALSIGRRDGDRLVEQSRRQQRHVRSAFTRVGLPDLPVHGALCFLDGDWGPGANGSRVEEVWVASPRRLKRLLTAPGPLTPAQVSFTAQRLSTVFLPAD